MTATWRGLPNSNCRKVGGVAKRKAQPTENWLSNKCCPFIQSLAENSFSQAFSQDGHTFLHTASLYWHGIFFSFAPGKKELTTEETTRTWKEKETISDTHVIDSWEINNVFYNHLLLSKYSTIILGLSSGKGLGREGDLVLLTRIQVTTKKLWNFQIILLQATVSWKCKGWREKQKKKKENGSWNKEKGICMRFGWGIREREMLE